MLSNGEPTANSDIQILLNIDRSKSRAKQAYPADPKDRWGWQESAFPTQITTHPIQTLSSILQIDNIWNHLWSIRRDVSDWCNKDVYT